MVGAVVVDQEYGVCWFLSVGGRRLDRLVSWKMPESETINAMQQCGTVIGEKRCAISGRVFSILLSIATCVIFISEFLVASASTSLHGLDSRLLTPLHPHTRPLMDRSGSNLFLNR